MEETLEGKSAWIHGADKPMHPKQKQFWRPAAPGTWKLNDRGSFLPNIDRGGAGGVMRNEAGHFYAAFATLVPFVTSAKQVELCAISEGLKLVTAMQISNVVIETDCLEAVSSIMDIHFTHVNNEGIIADIH
ncbi:uncharacterized protein LOC112184993 [Rosa chinensis]|uniref:uncharacterized protein LOC112184993 n=1 Tax=Rosa chinensis TaxID=74649 RepID=UPI000D094D4D|nr:uncharacterized protein LOC112184993 [Rosa chinensis]